MPSQTNCLRYWALSSQIRLDDAIALWCNVDPAQLASLGFDTQCMSAKRAALVTALRCDWRAYEAGVADSTMKAALATLAAAGINDGDEVAVHVRAARWQDGYVIDLCDEHWQAVVVTPSGWQVVAESPVLFTRTPSMRPLPMPAIDSDVGLLWQHTNVPACRRVMVLTWLLDGFRPDTPFPVLELVGEQGSAKSTTQSVLRSLVDPNKVMLRGRPKTVEDVFGF